MPLTCESIREWDPEAYAHCLCLSESKTPPVKNDFFTTQEIYAESIQRSEEVMKWRVPSVFAGLKGFKDHISCLEKRDASPPPWLPIRGTADAQADRILHKALTHIPRWTDGAKKGTLDYNRNLAKGLYHFFREGLKIAFTKEENPDRGYRDIPAIFREREWNCIETYVFAGVCEALGIEAEPIELLSHQHILIGLRLNPQDRDDLTFVDFQRGENGFDLPLSEDPWQRITKTALWARVLVNQAFPTDDYVNLGSEEGQRVRILIDKAQRLAPEDYNVIYHRGVFELLYGDGAEGKKLIKESFLLNPHFEQAANPL